MRVNEATIIVLAVLTVAALMMSYLFMLRYLIQYEISAAHLKIKLCGFLPVRSIELDSIVEVQTIAGWNDTFPFSRNFRIAFLIAERWPSYVFQKQGLFVRRRAGIVRYFILSPRNPEELSEHIRNAIHTLRLGGQL